MRRLMWAEFTAVAAIGLLSAVGFMRVFTGWSFLAPLAAASVVPILVSATGMYRRASAAATLLWSFLAFVAIAVVGVLGDTMPGGVPTSETAGELARGLTGGWADLLSVTLPAPAEPRVLVSVMALVWAACAIGAEFAHRSRSTVAPVVPGLALFLAMSAFAAPEPARSPLLAVGVAAAVLFVLLLHANRWAVIEPAGIRGSREAEGIGRAETGRPLSIERSAGRWTLLGTPLVAVAVLVAGLVVPRLAGRDDPFDPRGLRDQHIDLAGVPNPLDGLKAELARNPARPLTRFTVEPVDPPLPGAVDRIRLTVLDRFDGATWSGTELFARVGGGLPPAPPTGVGSTVARYRLTIENPTPGPWLPAPARATAIEPATDDGDLELGVDPGSGVLIAIGERRDFSYVVEAALTQPSGPELRALGTPPAGDGLRHLTEVPDLPDDLRVAAQRFTAPTAGVADSGTAYDRLLRLQRSLATTYGYSEEVPSGTSYGRLERFLDEERVGYAEQFAGAFAVLARALGFPTRLAYGYLVREVDPATGAAVDHDTVTSRQAHVWPEVLLGDGVWVPFEPTPARRDSPARPPEDPVADQLRDGGVVAGESPDASTGSSGGAGGQDPDGRFPVPLPVLVVAAAVLVVALLAMLLLAVKRRRRTRRRRAASTSDRVLGAWAEVTDRLLEVGVPVGASMTARDVVTASTDRVPGPAGDRLAAMAPVVGVALYAPVPPSEAHAEEMWGHADAFRREVVEGRPRRQAVAAALNPRPLVRRPARR